MTELTTCTCVCTYNMYMGLYLRHVHGFEHCLLCLRTLLKISHKAEQSTCIPYSGFVSLAKFSFSGQHKHFVRLKFGLVAMKRFTHAIPAHTLVANKPHHVLCFFVRQTFVFRVPERKKRNLNPTKQTRYTVNIFFNLKNSQAQSLSSVPEALSTFSSHFIKLIKALQKCFNHKNCHLYLLHVHVHVSVLHTCTCVCSYYMYMCL